MTSKAKRYLGMARPVILLAASLIVLPSGEFAAGANSENHPDLRARSSPPSAVRSAPGSRARQRAAEERATVNFIAGKRDPFEAPPAPKAGGGDDLYPRLPGVRGLVIDQLRLEGIVRDEESGRMIAVVTNGSNLAYFLHLHEEVYNGAVSRITPDAIHFQPNSRDSGNGTEAREVVLKLGSERQEVR
ncbi:MAG TPA: hypothetical protein VFZ27_18505 [Terriglobia bacterium]|nr:hypothetical protein [Terriglobia bacterium]